MLDVADMHSATSQGWAALWRFLAGIDLVDEVRAPARPVDEPVEMLFADPRACRTVRVRDEVWPRLNDVATASRLRAL
ncbi:hypothetical protein OG519_24250 [Streptomyces sp. NBC_01190]|nr:hypothetical protein OG519_24250 [Streptomyces sp. NBC_01190]